MTYVGVRVAIYQSKGFAVRGGNPLYKYICTVQYIRSSNLSTSPASRRLAGNASKGKYSSLLALTCLYVYCTVHRLRLKNLVQHNPTCCRTRRCWPPPSSASWQPPRPSTLRYVPPLVTNYSRTVQYCTVQYCTALTLQAISYQIQS
jgi:hypothetical protein